MQLERGVADHVPALASLALVGSDASFRDRGKRLVTGCVEPVAVELPPIAVRIGKNDLAARGDEL